MGFSDTVGGVSDMPPPPPPPPPPASLTARPGPVGYTGSHDAPRLHRVSKLATAATILCAVVAVMMVISVVLQHAVSDDADRYLAGAIAHEEFVEQAAPYLLVTALQVAAMLATAIIVITWMHRIASNHRALHRVGTWSPGWAIGGWFLPPMLYVIPALMFRELWKASDPNVPPGADWRSSRTGPQVFIWFALYSLIPLLLLIQGAGDAVSSFGTSETDMAQQIVDTKTSASASAALGVAGAIAFIALCRTLTTRHTTLTGEIPR